jgi:hypothetical protein
MSLSSDLREFLELLNARGVEYLVVGAHSLAFHGRPRYTGDLDVLIHPSKDNAALLVGLLHDFGFGRSNLGKQQLIQNKRAVGRPQDLADLEELE